MTHALETVLKQRALIPYVTLGDPSLEVSERLVLALCEVGATAIELGIPFSDPLADGPVIQASHHRALAAKPDISVADGFAMVARLRQRVSQSFVLMLSVNLVLQYGIDRFFADAALAGVAGVVIPDLPVEAADAHLAAARMHGVAIPFLVSPLCTQERLERLARASEGFVYLVASTGTTGARSSVDGALVGLAERIRAVKPIPVVVGFGISRPDHVQAVWQFAQGAIVGSFLVDLVGKLPGDPEQMIMEVSRAFRGLF